MTKDELIKKMQNGWIYIGQKIERDYFDGLIEDVVQNLDPEVLTTIGEICAYRAILEQLEKEKQ